MTMIYSHVSRLVEAEVTRSGDELDRLKLRKKVNEFLGIEVFQDAMENDDIDGMNSDILADYIGKLAQDEMNDLKSKANLEEFYNLERKVMLQSIDELWMRHIDAMSNLREDVAFE
jgi:preprotein translocase subunit SecA